VLACYSLGEEVTMANAKVWVRVSGRDQALLRRVYGVDALMPSAEHLPGRLVADATAATPELGLTARAAGVPFLIDPQTHFLQDSQPPMERWARLPFAISDAVSPGELASVQHREKLIEPLLQFQLDGHATTLIAPYVHINSPDSAWADIQARLWRSTRQVLDRHAITVPVMAVVAVGWRCLHPLQGVPALEPLWPALRALAPSEVALAASKVHLGENTDQRLVELLMFIRKLGGQYPVITWQQGLFGEACVAAGANGYETGIGWREACDLQQSMTSRRHISGPDNHPGAPPVYIPDLGRSIAKKTVKAVKARDFALWQTMICTDATCCAPGGADLVRDGRRHAMVCRATGLDTLNAADRAEWAWGLLADKAARGLDLANRINATAPKRVDLRALEAVAAVATARRRGRTHVATTAAASS
jgi:hypothetical protein